MRYIQGMPVQGISLRTPSESDAGAMIELLTCCYGETEYLTRTPEEFQITLQDEIEYLRRQERDERSCMICAFVEGWLVGNVHITPVGDARRVRHRAALGICVRKEYWGRGVGSMLMDAALQTADSAGYRQVELGVHADNARAIRLYRRFGFAEYGRCPGAMRRSDGSFADEILMARPAGEIR